MVRKFRGLPSCGSAEIGTTRNSPDYLAGVVKLASGLQPARPFPPAADGPRGPGAHPDRFRVPAGQSLPMIASISSAWNTLPRYLALTCRRAPIPTSSSIALLPAGYVLPRSLHARGTVVYGLANSE